MTEFYLGQKVVCVDDSATNTIGNPELVRGNEYVVRGLVEFTHLDKRYGIYSGISVMGIYRFCSFHNADVPFAASRFRPLESKSIEIFRKIARDVTEGRKVEFVE